MRGAVAHDEISKLHLAMLILLLSPTISGRHGHPTRDEQKQLLFHARQTIPAPSPALRSIHDFRNKKRPHSPIETVPASAIPTPFPHARVRPARAKPSSVSARADNHVLTRHDLSARRKERASAIRRACKPWQHSKN